MFGGGRKIALRVSIGVLCSRPMSGKKLTPEVVQQLRHLFDEMCRIPIHYANRKIKEDQLKQLLVAYADELIRAAEQITAKKR
jgi:hypothetical protein